MLSHEHITQFSQQCRVLWDHRQKASGNIQPSAALLYASSARKEKWSSNAESYASGSVFPTVLVRTLITPPAALMSEPCRKLSSLHRRSSPSYKEVSKHEGSSLSSTQRV